MFKDSMKILPCPNCESQDVEYKLENCKQTIRCSNCGRGISSISSEDTKKSMIEQWNKQVTRKYNDLKAMLKLVYTDIEEMSRKCVGYCEQCMLYNNGEKCRYKNAAVEGEY